VFKVFAKDESSVGYKDLKLYMNRLLQMRRDESRKLSAEVDSFEVTSDLAKEMIAQYDVDQDGRLCFEEFARMLMDKD
jgi:Ca2+-binding EF-hand superfamily protein